MIGLPISKARTGGARGHMVQVETQLQVADSGLLAVTNKRAVLHGESQDD